MKLYLDSVVLVPFLYGAINEAERHLTMRQLFAATRQGEVETVISFYILPELFGYVQQNYLPTVTKYCLP